MEKRVLISFLLTCCVAGFLVEEETLINDTHYFSLPGNNLFKKGMYVYDDDDNLIEVTLDIIHPEIEELTNETMSERVLFYLYTRKNLTHPQMIYVDDEDILKKSDFNPKKPTHFVTHGWMNSYKSSACRLVKDAYLEHGDYNVIVIGWSSISLRPYLWASNQVAKVATYVSRMLDFLNENGMNFGETIMAGHSLGAHVVGLGARNCNGKIGYVVGLDPALPNFYLARPGARISDSDANFVEIIHTNAGLLGFMSAIGHVDFYPNGGIVQSGCYIDVGGARSHARSFKFFAESINSKIGFYGLQCNSYTKYSMGLCNKKGQAIMGGLKTVFDVKGSYYLSTKSTSPYARGK